MAEKKEQYGNEKKKIEVDPSDMHQVSRKKQENGRKLSGGGIFAVYCGGLSGR